ncbi:MULTISPECIES: helix-turn-helix domain-containing protein [unclassified Paenibacillus]|uniref:winged helix-turn-helix domain-containing protein n=1 Tax=unclassified Paenibacillus TaxID=185978 RepID=UPI000956410F|nr:MULTISPECIES: helix-turn-helix domain-containing protein [unclassified Paenibacillus]ASS68667.1 hypothetical protein CIC07_22920 [Paenibacillus sp. RUD330]SIR55350.1 DNA-binding response regulator, OmpR family, contains REC and winged-helix (wHTH) domain [Paenibacillus sp. RU4X]SIR63891.1 DNA-binding response regulator, OmpR family, contains REC and winged-helix (wHTH) domain [Paenibacillus sp. RU4T]
MPIAVVTDRFEKGQFLCRLFREAVCMLYSASKLLEDGEYTLVIFVVDRMGEEEWIHLKSLLELGIETYLMVPETLSEEEAAMAHVAGVRHILHQPPPHDQPLPEEHRAEAEQVGKSPASFAGRILDVGCGIVFHPEQCWVGDGKEIRVELSEKEACLLSYFIRHEGKLITKHALAAELWGGFIQPSGVLKLIKRLKIKLGPASATISSRKSGGCLYTREPSGPGAMAQIQSMEG